MEFVQELFCWSVTQLTLYLKEKIESDELLGNVMIRGEISNFTRSAAGHCYFVLRDQWSQISCVMFQSRNTILKFKPENGLMVIVLGRVSIYEKQGQYQVIAEEMKPEGIGEIFLALEQLKEKLSKEGLFDAAHKRIFPFLPQTVGIVTSLRGAAIHDMITIIRKRNDAVKIIIAPALVQGDEAPDSIVKAINELNLLEEVDIIIAGRGGGSIEELMPFNDERVARAIYNSRVPVISAVGHETDFTIADLVADLRAPTPTAAAQMVVPEKAELIRRVNQLLNRQGLALTGKAERLHTRLEGIMKKTVFRFPLTQVEHYYEDLDRILKRLGREITAVLKSKKERMIGIASKLEALSPLKILDRGFSLCRNIKDSGVIKSIKNVNSGDKIDVMVSDGNFICTVD
ncbi:MAG: exodeoxyribonuclease VII large subunit [Firmicutes bacterium]|nr:exodeoxyribonuclease VII large subunit [Bacillota bacterium]